MATYTYKFNEAKTTKLTLLSEFFDLAEVMRDKYETLVLTMSEELAIAGAIQYAKDTYCYVRGVNYPIIFEEEMTLKNIAVSSTLHPYLRTTACDAVNAGVDAAGYLGIKYEGNRVALIGHKGLQTTDVGQLLDAYCADDGRYYLKVNPLDSFSMTATCPVFLEDESVIELINVCEQENLNTPFAEREFEVFFKWEPMRFLVPEYVDNYVKKGVWPPVDVPEEEFYPDRPDPLTEFDGTDYEGFLDTPGERFRGMYYNPLNTRVWNYPHSRYQNGKFVHEY